MGIQVDCTECGQRMVDGVLQHTKKCSANQFMPITSIGRMPPGQTIHFDTPEEQQAFMDKLKSGSSAMKGYKVMPNHPTPQRIGRTAQEILDYADPNHPARFWRKQAAQRQLFNAMTALLPKPINAEAYDHEPVKMYERGYNAAVEKMAKKLAVFFAQPTVNDKPPTADSRTGGVDGGAK